MQRPLVTSYCSEMVEGRVIQRGYDGSHGSKVSEPEALLRKRQKPDVASLNRLTSAVETKKWKVFRCASMPSDWDKDACTHRAIMALIAVA